MSGARIFVFEAFSVQKHTRHFLTSPSALDPNIIQVCWNFAHADTLLSNLISNTAVLM